MEMLSFFSLGTGTLLTSAVLVARRPSPADEAAFVSAAAESYVQLAALHAEENAKSFDEVEADKARRADRRDRDVEYDQQQGIERDYVSTVCVCSGVRRADGCVVMWGGMGQRGLVSLLVFVSHSVLL